MDRHGAFDRTGNGKDPPAHRLRLKVFGRPRSDVVGDVLRILVGLRLHALCARATALVLSGCCSNDNKSIVLLWTPGSGTAMPQHEGLFAWPSQ